MSGRDAGLAGGGIGAYMSQARADQPRGNAVNSVAGVANALTSK